MSVIELILLSAALAMDAFAVSVTEGIRLPRMQYMHACKIALLFGVFQAIMPVIGFWAGRTVYVFISHIDHWIAAGLLCFIGGRMIVSQPHESASTPSDTRTLLMLALATSIDALAIGITLALQHTDIAMSAIVIGVITFFICFTGVILGGRLGRLFQKRAEIAGGIVLILLGVKLLLEHLL